MEGVSAKILDSKEQVPKSREAIAHLREMRDVLTPFVKKFSQLFDEGADSTIPDLNKPEHVSKALYDAIFFKYFQNVSSEDEITQSMFVNMGDPNTHDLLYEKFQVVDSDKKPIEIPEDTPEYIREALSLLEATHKQEAVSFLEPKYKKFLEDLEASGLEEYFLKIGRDKRAALWRVNSFVRRNTKAVKQEMQTPGSTPTLGNLANHVEIEDAEEVIYGFPVGMSLENKRESLDPFEVFPSPISFPVGEYGRGLAGRIFNTTQVLYSKVSLLKDEARRMVTAHEKMFKAIARGEHVIETTKAGYTADDIKKAELNYMAGLLALEEGITTLAQVLAMLTANKVEGFGSGEELLKAIIEQELPNKAGHAFSPAVIGPLSLAGMTIKDVLQRDELGRLIINRKLLDFCSEKKGVIIKESKETNPPASGRGCPVSFGGKDIETSGINMLSQTFVGVFEKLK